MRLKKIQEALKTKNIIFTYTEEDNCGSLDFQFRGLRYHIWEFVDGDIWGVETNVYHAGKSEDITGDYEKEISELILSWYFCSGQRLWKSKKCIVTKKQIRFKLDISQKVSGLSRICF